MEPDPARYCSSRNRLLGNGAGFCQLDPWTSQRILHDSRNLENLAGRHDIGVDEEELWRSAGKGIQDISSGVGKPLIGMLYPNFRGNDAGSRLAVQVGHSPKARGTHSSPQQRSGALTGRASPRSPLAQASAFHRIRTTPRRFAYHSTAPE